MKFTQIHIQNFLSVSDITVEFKNGIHLISGLNKDMVDSGESNGAGKSSIFDALSWVLFGKIDREGAKKGDVVNNTVKKNCRVELHFQHRDSDYKILRTRNDEELGNFAEIWIDGEAKGCHTLTDTDSRILGALPVSKSILQYAVLVGQGMPNRFMSLSETGKRDLLADIVDLSMYDLAADRVSEELKKSIHLTTIEQGKMQSIESQLYATRDRGILAKSKLEEMSAKSTFDKDAVDQELKDIASLVQRGLQFIQETQVTLEEVQKRDIEYWTIVTQRESKRLSPTNELSKLRTKVQMSEQEIRRLSSVDTNVPCPTCTQDVDPSMVVDRVEELNSQIAGWRSTDTLISEGLIKFDEETMVTRAAIKEGAMKRERLTAQVNQANGEIQKAQYRESTLKTMLLEDNADRAPLQAAIKEAEHTVLELEDSKAVVQQALTTEENTAAHIKYWKDSIPQLKAAALEEVLQFLNVKIAEYMDIMSGGSIKVILYQEAYGKGSKIKVDIKTSGGTYGLSSGGERRRVDLALYLALSDLVESAHGVSCNLLVCDEITDNLSVSGTVRFLEALRHKAQSGKGVYVITHNVGVQQYFTFDSVYNIVKEGGMSRLDSIA